MTPSIISFFFIYPLYSILGIFLLIYKQKKIGYILLAFFLSLLAYMLVPREGMDLDTHFKNFTIFKKT